MPIKFSLKVLYLYFFLDLASTNLLQVQLIVHALGQRKYLGFGSLIYALVD